MYLPQPSRPPGIHVFGVAGPELPAGSFLTWQDLDPQPHVIWGAISDASANTSESGFASSSRQAPQKPRRRRPNPRKLARGEDRIKQHIEQNTEVLLNYGFDPGFVHMEKETSSDSTTKGEGGAVRTQKKESGDAVKPQALPPTQQCPNPRQRAEVKPEALPPSQQCPNPTQHGEDSDSDSGSRGAAKSIASWADALDSAVEGHLNGSDEERREIEIRRKAHEAFQGRAAELERELALDASREALARHGLLDKEGQPSSIGSLLHAAGTCRICLFAKSGKCHRGLLCGFCHLTHPKPMRKKNRPAKFKREKFERYLKLLEEDMELSANSIDIESLQLPPTFAGDVNLRRKLQAKLRKRMHEVRQEMLVPADAPLPAPPTSMVQHVKVRQETPFPADAPLPAPMHAPPTSMVQHKEVSHEVRHGMFVQPLLPPQKTKVQHITVSHEVQQEMLLPADVPAYIPVPTSSMVQHTKVSL